jgi:hypothetical protein
MSSKDEEIVNPEPQKIPNNPSPEPPIVNPDASQTTNNSVECKTIEEIQKTGVELLVKGLAGFQPTAAMIKCAYSYIYENDDNDSPTQVLENIGLHRSNWYVWKDTEKFLQWWFQVNYDTIALQLPDLYKNLLKRGKNNDTAAAKLIIERFDKDYKPQNSTENKVFIHSPEQAKEDMAVAEELAKKRIDCVIKGENDEMP